MEKVKLYNQILQRYNELVDRRIKQPTRVVVVNGDVAAAAGCVEVDIAGSILKTMKGKAQCLIERLKADLE